MKNVIMGHGGPGMVSVLGSPSPTSPTVVSSQKLNINLIFDQSALAAPAAFRTATQTCATQLQNLIVSTLTINIDVGYGGYGGSPTTPDQLPTSNYGTNYTASVPTATFAQIKNALISRAVSANAQAAVLTLPGSDPTGGASYQLTPSQAYNYGLIAQPGAQSHWIAFGSAINWNYTQSPGPTEYDFNATCLHELTEAIGRHTPLCGTLTASAMDLYRWNSAGVRGLGGLSGPGYFSINSGTTPLHTYRNSNCGAGGDAGDWETSQSPPSPFDSNPTIGQVVALQSFDLIQIDTLGWSSQ